MSLFSHLALALAAGPQNITWSGVARGIGVGLLGLTLGFVIASMTYGFMTARGRGLSSRRVLSRLVFWIIAALSLAAALTIVFPSINPVDILGGLGVISIAAGIAFQTVLGNMFAGIVILSRDLFRVNDQVKVGDNAGTITAIHLSSTSIRTFDGQLVIVPNTVMHSSQVIVQTGFERIRTGVTVAISTSADLEHARTVAEKAMSDLDLVMNDPAPRALYSDIGVEAVNMELLFWSGSTKLESREATDIIIRTVLAAFRREGIPLATNGLEKSGAYPGRDYDPLH